MKLGIIRFIQLTLLFVLLQSCTVLQWRSTDEEIYHRFETAKVPTQISYFEVDSLDLRIRIQSVSQGNKNINVLFFHGSPSSLSAWNRYLLDSTLINTVTMHAIDRPGYGYSNFGEEMPNIGLQAQLMSELIDQFEFENVIAVGSSYGGPLAARLAVLNERVKGVLMISPAIDPRQEKHIKGVMWTQFWLTGWMVPTGYRVAGDEKVVHAAELAKLEADWSKVTVPVIHIHGNQDDIVPYGNINYTKSVFSNIKTITTPNTGHEIAWGRPELIIPHLELLIEETKEDN